MRKGGFFLSVILSMPVMLWAQRDIPKVGIEANGPRATIFGGYSYLRNATNGINEWEGQGTFNLTRYFGITGDVSGNFLSPGSFSILGISAGLQQHLYTFFVGPTVTANFGRSAVFAHALFGEAHSSLGVGVSLPFIGGISTGLTSANAFAMAFGGGVDIGLTRHFAIRAAQVDYVRTQFNAINALAAGLSSSLGNRQGSLRYSAGVVFRF